MRVIVLFLALVGSVRGHGFVVSPPPRNSIDKDQPLFADGKYPQTNGEPGCTQDMQVCGCWAANGESQGQSCYWFSQGCTIGCDHCFDGQKTARENKDLCHSGLEATVCDHRMRTYNMNATCNGPDDKYRWNPWRYPGSAPVQDPCGKAGGGGVLINNTGSARVGYGAAFFTDTVHAKANDLGSKVLPPMPTGTVWRAGERVEAMWSIRANHGGGYQYRLCPSQSNLTEACFKAMPLAFVGEQSLQYRNGTRERIPSSYTFENGTGFHTGDYPNPSPGTPGPGLSFLAQSPGLWARNPIPDHRMEQPGRLKGLEFPAPCAHDDTSAPTKGLCSGERPFHISIVDVLQIPADIPAGDYVVGWRWDCEESAQIWSSCSDITITS